jgi:hypothetical protein
MRKTTMNKIAGKRVTIGEHGLYICYQSIAEGEVIESSSDRVGITSGSSFGSVTSNVSSHAGHISSDVSSTWSFDITTDVEVRHEFWLKCADGLDRQFVMPTHIPLIKGHRVALRQIYFEYENDVKQKILAIEFINHNTQKTHYYSLTGAGYDCTLADISGNLRHALAAEHPSMRDLGKEIVLKSNEDPKNAWVSRYRDRMLTRHPILKELAMHPGFFCTAIVLFSILTYENIDVDSTLTKVGLSLLAGFVTYVILGSFILYIAEGGLKDQRKRWNDGFVEPTEDAEKFITNQLSSVKFP